ncbi:MAG: hypothetical protein P8104_02235, partial [Gammaproteobacteria bacterium]
SPSTSTQYRHGFQLFCLLFCLVFMHLVSYREVRYLIYLMPLTALILVPSTTLLLKWKRELLTLVLVLLLIDYVRIVPFALAQVTLGSRLNIIKLFKVLEDIRPLDDSVQNATQSTTQSTTNPIGSEPENPENSKTPEENKVLISPILSFALFPDSPIIGDRYHGYYHLSDLLVFNLFESRYIVKALPKNFGIHYADLSAGDAVVYANHQLVRNPKQPEEDALFFNNFFQISGIVKHINLKRDGDFFYAQNSTGPLLIVPPDHLQETLTFVPKAPAAADLERWGWATAHDETATILAIEVNVLCKRGWCYPIEAQRQGEASTKQ